MQRNIQAVAGRVQKATGTYARAHSFLAAGHARRAEVHRMGLEERVQCLDSVVEPSFGGVGLLGHPTYLDRFADLSGLSTGLRIGLWVVDFFPL